MKKFLSKTGKKFSLMQENQDNFISITAHADNNKLAIAILAYQKALAYYTKLQ